MSYCVHNLWKFNKKPDEMMVCLIEGKKEYTQRLMKRLQEIKKKEMPIYKQMLEEKMGKERVSKINNLDMCLLRDFRKEIIACKKDNQEFWNCHFTDYINDFLVDVALYQHPRTKEFFIQLFGSQWAIEQLIEIFDLKEDYSFDNRTDFGYENNYEKMEEDEKFLQEMIKISPDNDGLIINIADVPIVLR